ncbi:MAG: transglutaminase domain-containing protein, partial [Dehalococcoidia bacterium]
QLHSYQQRLRWAQEKVAYPPSAHASAITLGISGIFVIILVAAFVPVRAPMVDWLHEGWDWLRTPVTHIEDNISRAFIALPSRTGATYRSFGDYLAFQGPISLSDDPYFLLDAEVPLYLRSRAYPVYTAQGWIANDTAEIEGPDLPPFEPAPESGQLTAEYTVTSLVSTTGLPVSALPVEAPEETIVLVQAPKRFLIPADPDTRIADDLPSDLSAAVSVLRQEDGGEGTVRDPDVLLRALPDNVTVTSLRFRENGDEEDVSIPPDAEGSVLAAALAEHPGRLMWIEVTRREPAPLDALGLSSSDPYSPGDAYTLTSLFSDATPDELRLAGTAYPAWVTDTYLQLPDTLPQRVRALAEAITADRPTPYGKAAAVVGFLHSIPYDQDIPAPAFDADGVDHFLFEVGRGYSQYFGSTMAVLMRASGVPARLVIGYAPREQDPDTGVWIVRERDSHGWAEVYFPGYGWVEFEPTPGRDGLASADDGTPVTGSPGVSFPDEFFDEDDEFLEGPGLPPGSGSQTPSPDTFGTVLRIIAGIAGGLLALGLLGYAYFAAFVSTPAPRAIFQRMSRLGALTGLRYRRQQTPLEYGRRLAQALPRAGEDATFLCDVFTKARYGTGPLEPWESERLGTAWRNVQRALLRRAFRHNPILG